MRKLTILLALLVAPVAFSKDQSTVVQMDVYCFKFSAITKELENRYGEDPIVIGKSSLEKDVATIVYVSQETGSYTIVESDGNVACILASGTNVRYRMPKTLERKAL